MKKSVLKALLVCFVLIFALSACKKEEDEPVTEAPVQKVEYQKAIVIYFSKAGENYSVGTVAVGNTAMMAKYISDYLNADSYEILPKVPYPNGYEETRAIANRELAEQARPEILNEITNLDEYDTIFLGYPIWCNDLPMIMYTFLETHDFAGKTIVPFNTHGGSGNAGTYKIIAEKLPHSIVNQNGLYLNGKVARSESGKNQTIEWLKSLGY